MKLVVVSGSHNKDSQSGRIAKIIRDEVLKKKLFDEVHVHELGENHMPHWHDDFGETPEAKKIWEPMLKQLQECDAIVCVSPEWAGMVPPALKNYLLMCTFKKALAHKPGLIVGVSSTRGGSYPVVELRMSGYKNNFLTWIPDHVIIRDCESIFAGKTDPDTVYVEDRLRYALGVLRQYAMALKEVRNSKAIDLKKYPNGM